MGAIYIVRHGQADPSAYGVAEAADSSVPIGSLTDTGVMQAKLSGALLSSLVAKVDAAFTGTLPRQQQTLAAVLEQFPGAPAPVGEATRWESSAGAFMLSSPSVGCADRGWRRRCRR